MLPLFSCGDIIRVAVNIHLLMTGCKNNRYELNRLWEWANEHGFTIDENRPSDFSILNTCAVTQSAERKTRQMVQAVKKTQPKAKIIVFGCMARLNATTLKKMKAFVLPDLDSVIRLLERFEIGDSRLEKNSTLNSNLQSEIGVLPRARALVQVQDGCDNFCSYCSIVLARGRSNSRPMENVVADVKRYENEGFTEVMLTGINIAAYGCSTTQKPNESRFADLLQAILEDTRIPRIRLGSLGPQYFSEPFFQILKNPRICNHFHLSLQSGSNSVLKRMNRGYKTAEAESIIQRLKTDIPSVAITADMIVGFPEETEDEFQETLDFAKRNPMAKIHVFPYSSRPGTTASRLKPINPTDIRSRAKILRDLSARQRMAFLQSQIGQKFSVIWRKEARPGWTEGVTDNGIRLLKKATMPRRSMTEEMLTKENVVID